MASKFIHRHERPNESPVGVGVFVDVVLIGGRIDRYIQAGFVNWKYVSDWRYAEIDDLALSRLPVIKADIDAIHRRACNA